MYDASSFVLLCQDYFDSLGILWYHTNFRIIFSISVNNAFVILTEIALNLQIALGSMDILTIVIFPFTFVFFIQCLQFPVYKSFTSFQLIPKYFILFDAIVNEILFSISVSTCSLLEYKNTTDFVQIFLSCHFAEFVYSISFFVESLDFLYIRSCHLLQTIIQSGQTTKSYCITQGTIFNILR